MKEFHLINRYFAGLTPAREDVVLGIGDDAAILSPPPGHTLAMTCDTLIAGVHFPEETDPFSIGYKALAVNLSDLAAMGAQPAWVTLALTLPRYNEPWLEDFARGFRELATHFGIALVGGDTTRGLSLAITIQATGWLPQNVGLYRHLGKAGDLIFVTGSLGAAALGLAIFQGKHQAEGEVFQRAERALNRPWPRVAEGLQLRSLASSAIDISDGFAQDLNHILNASEVGATIWVDKLPLALGLSREKEEDILLALTGGDDYELCFTAPAWQRTAIEQVMVQLGTPCHCVGMLEVDRGVHWKSGHGKPVELPHLRGYQHF